MAFHKFRADQLFDGYRLLDSQQVLITTEEGVIENIAHINEAGDDVQSFNGILSPGFINCHCHLELSHMKGYIPEGTGLIKFVTQVIKDRHFAETEILSEIEKAETEMLSGGIVAVGDICNNILTIPQKVKGRIRYHNFIEASGFLPQLAEQRFDRAKEIYCAYTNNLSAISSYSPLGVGGIVPHAPYSVSEELWEKIIHFPGNQLLTIHNQETEGENELFLHRQGEFLDFYQTLGMDASFFQSSGKTSLQTYLSKFLPNQQLILVHNVHTSAEDLTYCHQKVNSQKIYWCLCPNANLYIGGKLPAIDLFIQNELSIVLGTDSLASNHQLSIVAEMRAIQDHFPSVKTEQLLGWATINGARALQLDNILGSFEKGKKPGVVVTKATFSGSKRLL
jgi:cytosine/adenosine deaminase-related metal-dependent hydrolase